MTTQLELDEQTLEFVKHAIDFYIDYNENSIRNRTYEKELQTNDSSKLYRKLLATGLAPQRLRMLASIYNEMNQLNKCTCGGTDFNIECPIVVCTKCHKEYFIATDECIDYCKSCAGFKIGDCEAKQHIKEYEDGK